MPPCPLLGLAPGGVYLAGTVTRTAVRSYRTIAPLPLARRYLFCGTFPVLADGRRYLSPCPVEPGLSSLVGRWLTPVPSKAAVRPTRDLTLSYRRVAFPARGSHRMTDVLSLAIDDPFPAELHGSAVSVGNFDGVHLGHTALIAELRQEARRLNTPAVAVTFDPHPLRLLAPDRFLPQLTTPEDRAELLLNAGANWVVILKTTPDLLRLEANEFLQRLFVDRFAAKAVIEGFNFGFGRDRTGTTESLKSFCRDNSILSCIVTAKMSASGEPVSSSRVRAALDARDVAGAARLLGRPYRLRGTVVVGDRRGATLGFPTANLGDCRTVIPGDGVYAVRVQCACGEFMGAANIGPNPTFGVSARKVEVHLLDFDQDLYGQPVAVDFVEQLRNTRKFESKEELVRQLHEDVDQTRRKLASADRLLPAGGESDDLKARIQSVLEVHVAPALSLEVGGLEVLDVIDGVVRIRVTDVCAACPATVMTLIMGIEQELRKHLPEVEYLEAVP